MTCSYISEDIAVQTQSSTHTHTQMPDVRSSSHHNIVPQPFVELLWPPGPTVIIEHHRRHLKGASRSATTDRASGDIKGHTILNHSRVSKPEVKIQDCLAAEPVTTLASVKPLSPGLRYSLPIDPCILCLPRRSACPLCLRSMSNPQCTSTSTSSPGS